MALYRAENGWKSLADPERRAGFLALFSDHAEAARWLDAHLDDFIALEAQALRFGGPRSWVHHDVRSDNLIFRGADAPLLIDFPHLAYGPTLMDVAFFSPQCIGRGRPVSQRRFAPLRAGEWLSIRRARCSRHRRYGRRIFRRARRAERYSRPSAPALGAEAAALSEPDLADRSYGNRSAASVETVLICFKCAALTFSKGRQ